MAKCRSWTRDPLDDKRISCFREHGHKGDHCSHHRGGQLWSSPRKKAPPGTRWYITHFDPKRKNQRVRQASHDYIDEVVKEKMPYRTVFDEIIIDDWLHLEQMNPRGWWMRVCGRTFWVKIDKYGTAKITEEKTT